MLAHAHSFLLSKTGLLKVLKLHEPFETGVSNIFEIAVLANQHTHRWQPDEFSLII